MVVDMSEKISKILSAFILVGVILVSCFVSQYYIRAAGMTKMSVSLTAQAVGQSGNTTIKFRTPTGVDAPTDNITITWPAGFDLTSIILTDIDFSHGAVSGYETDETLAAAPAIGVWGAAIAGQILTLTAPTNAGAGEVNASDYVVIEVGAHASFGGGGANQIVNPIADGSYRFIFGGTLGDSGEAAVWISADNTVGITGDVPAIPELNCNNGIDDDLDGFIDCDDTDCITNPVCSPPGGGDTTPPIISNIRCIDITPTSFSVAWDTNEPATSCSEYGETILYELGMECNMSLVYSHSVPLVGLLPLTDYHYRIITRDQYFNTAISADYTCTTLGDIDAPIISNIRVIDLTCDSVEIIWDTNEPATSQVDYGLTPAHGSETPIDMTYVVEHHVVLTGLAGDTDYHFIVRSYDLSGNGVVSGDSVFHTSVCVDAPVISNFRCESITETSMDIVWETDELADSTVDYGQTITYELGSVSDPTAVIDHAMPLTSLNPNTAYHVRARSTDLEFNETLSADLVCSTLPDTTPPVNVTNFTATPGPGPLEITLDWTNPSDPDFAGVRICRSEIGYPVDPLTCVVIYQGSDETYIDSDVIAGVMYYYTNFAFDTSGNFASGAIASARIPILTTFNFIGHPEKRWPRTNNWDTTIELGMRTPGSLIPIETTVFDTNSLGLNTFTMSSLEYGESYDVTAKGFSHLRKKIGPITLIDATTTVDFTLGNTFDFYAGDCHISKDNYVNSLDVSTLINDIMTSERVSDLNDDSQVNSLDITVQLANLMQDLGDD